ncbi:MAG TPA: fumarylacetoacetate hydrolase family protein [Steroidobacteraceae bacterium]|nr:fumarylacetoacetate hydrolase family protein [Steroidobacteraceae bacterium]
MLDAPSRLLAGRDGFGQGESDMSGFLPVDAARATLLGRVDLGEGPTPVVLRGGRLEDLSAVAPTVADLLNSLAPGDPPPAGPDLGTFASQGFGPAWLAAGGRRLLAPLDLQCIKAAGVTFAASALERVIEEQARGDPARAQALRAALAARIGADLRSVRPGTEEAARLKAALVAEGMWSQYLEVAIGPDAEIFTKAPVLAAVGWGEFVGIRADSAWNNPEPEVVIVCDGAGRARGATLGNDVNLRDLEGRSALLLGKAKDNNASCAVGPFVRLFDEHFTLDDVRSAAVRLEIVGEEGFRLVESSDMGQISRDPLELVRQASGENHQYPDGFALFLGTMFAPIQDRGAAGQGFTHHLGDLVRISSPSLGVLENKVGLCGAIPPWTYGLGALMRNLAGRGLLAWRQP